MTETTKLVARLNAETSEERLEALEALMRLEKQGQLEPPQPAGCVNNHIHTTYSFSPYSPTKALWLARAAGLETAGIMDHDSVGGDTEFIRAGELAGMAITCGFECRVSFAGTPFEGRRLNNPDQVSVAYVALHGIPHQNIGLCEEFLKPLREKRNLRNRAMVEKLNGIAAPCGVALDFDADVVPLSRSHEGGSITERHILFALALKLMQAAGPGPGVAALLEQKLGLALSPKQRAQLADPQNPFYAYDLLGVMKGSLVAAFYIDATDECPPVADFVAFAARCGGIAAYAYLGDVGDSITGDKKAQAFEDGYLDELFDYLDALGFHAITYMPSRNTEKQLDRIIALCLRHGLFEISGEDINTPRQSFICTALRHEKFRHLGDSTWALIGHERAATRSIEEGMFSAATRARLPRLSDRVAYYAKLGSAK